MAKVGVIGAGSWGTALSVLLHSNGHEVEIWSISQPEVDMLNAEHEHKDKLPGVKIAEDIRITTDLEGTVKGKDLLVLAVPSPYTRSTAHSMAPFVADGQLIVNVAKGIETDTLKCMHEICAEILGDNLKYVTLSGPSHAEEVARGIPTAVVSASENIGLAKLVQETFMTRNFRIYTSRDVISVELGGALKNVLAIAAGILDGMQLGDNPKAALMTRGIAEMARLGVALGGKRETFAGLSGIGDLIVTCMSRHSRNRHVGEELGRGKTLEQITAEMGMVVAEGVKTAISAHMLAQRKNCETPIINAVFNVLYNNLSAKDAAYGLMTREPRDEED